MNNPSQTKDMNELNNNGLREQVQDIVHRHYIFVVHHAHKEGLDSVETTQAIQALITKQVRLGRLRGIEEVLLRLKQAPPIDWIDAQAWIDGEYERVLAQLKDTGGDKT